jgi:hypothetical protein
MAPAMMRLTISGWTFNSGGGGLKVTMMMMLAKFCWGNDDPIEEYAIGDEVKFVLGLGTYIFDGKWEYSKSAILRNNKLNSRTHAPSLFASCPPHCFWARRRQLNGDEDM